jgi:YkoY family integral membrane protein
MWQELFGNDLGTGLFVVLNLVIIESLLSVDNAAVLAVIVQHLPVSQRSRALRYGILGAYVLRGACLVLAAWLVKILWLKILGGLYLLWLAYKHFSSRSDDDVAKGIHAGFWKTVVIVEVMDLVFSIDNVFAAVAFSKHIGLICLGVFIGILAMRFVAQGFVKLMQKFPFLEDVTFVVISLLGIKLMLTGICDYIPGNAITPVLNMHITDILFSVGIMLTFFMPVLYKYLKTRST